MNTNYIAFILLVLFLVGCVASSQTNTPNEDITKTPQGISEDTDISDFGEIDEELNTQTLGTLEEDLRYIENI